MDDPLFRSMLAYLSVTVGLAFLLGLYIGWALWKWLPMCKLGSRLPTYPPPPISGNNLPLSPDPSAKPGSTPESGSIFTILIASIALSGALSVMLYQQLSGPVASMSRITKKAMVDTQMLAASKIAIMDATNQAASGDCDSDGSVEVREWRDTAGGKPANGGLIPLTIGAPVTDPWNSDYGYCVWDVGSFSDPLTDNGCGLAAKRLEGTPTPTAGLTNTQTVLAVISAGADRVFTTTCKNYSATVNDATHSTTDLIATSGDDVVMRYTYAEAAAATSSLWSIKVGNPDVAEIAKDLEITAGGGGSGSIISDGAIIAGGGIKPGTEATISACAAGTNVGMIRYNTATPGLEVCNGAAGWEAASGGGTAKNFQPDNAINCAEDLDPVDGVSDHIGEVRYNTTTELPEFCDGMSWLYMVVSACDSAPAFPVFTDQDELAGSTLITSNIVAITGMDVGCSATVGVSGTGGSPQYRVCSDAACSSEIQTWTASNTAQTMQGNYIQLRATSSASSGTTLTMTASVGMVDSDWGITTGISGCSPVGTICSDGSVYAGLSPDGDVPMYIPRCDLGQTWNGSVCAGTRSSLTWNAGDSGWVDTGLVNCGAAAGCAASGESNTTTLVATDASTAADVQDHVAARECGNLNVHGQTDWYLPSARELDVIYDNLVDGTPVDSSPNPLITGFSTDGSNYWSSSENVNYLAWYQRFSDGAQGIKDKNVGYLVRCARR